MKTFKRFFIYFVCLIVLLSSFISSFSAVEYNPYTGEEMIYDSEGDYWYAPDAPLQWDPFMPLISSEPSYSSFDYKRLPWLDMPAYIQEILYGSYVGNVSDVSYTGEVKLPFVMIVVHSSTIHIFAGWNVFIGSYCSSADVAATKQPSHVFISARKESNQIYQNSVLYHAHYNPSDYSLKTDWQTISPVELSERYVRYASIDFNASGKDYYCYGFNTVKPGAVAFSQSISSDSEWSKVYVVNDSVSGFQSGKFVYWPDSWSNTYFAAFTPPTQEQLQNETSKGIWGTLKSVLDYVKNLPSNIANSIKAFFTSLGDRISGFFVDLIDRLRSYFQGITEDLRVFFTSIGDRISGFFSDLFSDISDYFDTFKNYLLYFQSTEAKHVNPFDNLLTDIQNFFDDQMSDVDDFKGSMNAALNDVVIYISSGSGIINKFLTSAPLVSAFVTFFVVFFIVRKVIGR